MAEQSRAGQAKNKHASAEGDDYVLEDQVGYLLRRAHQRATAIFMSVMADSQLTPRQFAALVKISDLGAVSQNELGRLTAMDPATMQGVTRRLRQRGLISRGADPNDRRRMLLALTPAGERLLAGGTSEKAKRVSEDTLAPLRPNERRSILRLLKKLT